MAEIRKIGILTSGGDCSGLNTAVYAVTFAAIRRGWEVYGIENATDGLIGRPMAYRRLRMPTFNFPFAKLGGTMLGTNSSGNPNEQISPDGTMEYLTDRQVVNRFKEGIKELGLDALVVVGGDGSMAMISQLCKKAKIKMVGIPKTIDKDAPGTDSSIGFATARTVVMNALDNLDTTASSHHRVMILEVMGRNAGHLALEGAVAGLADICLIPEIPYSYFNIVNHLRKLRAYGRQHALMVVAEGVKTPEGKQVFESVGNKKSLTGIGDYFAQRLLQEPDNFSVRSTRLGHIQRGGSPVAGDRVLATSFGVRAVELLAANQTDKVVGYREGKILDMDLKDVLKIANTPVRPDSGIVRTARGLGMYIGE